MSKDERIRFENKMVDVFKTFGINGKYFSLTPGHKDLITDIEAENMREAHYLFSDMTTDPHLVSSGIASDWPFGRGIWMSDDKKKMVWVGEEDQLRIISIVHGSDLG
jgi:creatine kinase